MDASGEEVKVSSKNEDDKSVEVTKTEEAKTDTQESLPKVKIDAAVQKEKKLDAAAVDDVQEEKKLSEVPKSEEKKEKQKVEQHKVGESKEDKKVALKVETPVAVSKPPAAIVTDGLKLDVLSVKFLDSTTSVSPSQ